LWVIFIVMITLKRLLNEDIKFQSGYDSDRPSGAKTVFVFNPNDKYITKGKTHGLMSHAIKHGYEFDLELYEKVISETNKIIKNSPNSILLNSQNERPEKGFGYPYPKGVVINTMDMVNDKISLKDELHPEEQKIASHLKVLTDRYESMLVSIIQKSVDVSELKTVDEIREVLKKTDTLKFTVESRGSKIYVVTSIKEGVVVLVDLNGTVLSGYKPSIHKKKWSGIEKLRKYFSSTSVTVTNHLIKKLFDVGNDSNH